MVGIFVRLKLRLLASMFRSWQQALGYLLPLFYGIPAGIGLALALATVGRTDPTHGPDLLVGAFALLLLGWTVGPLVAGGLDSTVDPDSLTLFPLTRRELARGLLAAGTIGISPLLTALVCIGALIGFLPVGPGAVLVVPAVLVELALCLVAARAVTSTVSRALRGRRARDLLTLVGFVGVLALSQLPSLAIRTASRSDGLTHRAAQIAGWTPLGWAGSAAAAGAAGRLLPALGWLAASAALLAAVSALWWRNLGRVGDRGGSTLPDGTRGSAELDTALSRLLPHGALRACLAKDQRYLAREPMLRLSVVAAAGGSVLFVLALSTALPGRVTYPAAFGGVMCALGTANCLGAERGASWTLLATGVSWRTVLGAKVLSFAVLFLPLQAVLIVAVGLLGGHPGQIAVVIPLSVGMYAAATAGTLYGSVLFPYPLPESRAGAGLFGNRAGGGGTTSALQGVVLLVAMVLVTPAAVGVGVAGYLGGLPAAVVAAPFALVYGLALLGLSWTLSVRRLAGRGPEVVTALSAQRT